MVVENRFYFQWQNPVLRKTIYPFREKKLQDFLLYFKEIDLWQELGNSEVDAKVAAELVAEHNKLRKQLEQAEAERNDIGPSLKALKQQQREAASSPEVRSLIYKKNSLQSKITSLKAKKNTLKRRVDWYNQFAPDHPYFEKYSREYELAKIPYEQTLADLEATEKAYNARMGGFDTQTISLNEKLEQLSQQIRETNELLDKLPHLGRDGEVSQSAAVRWLVLKYQHELDQLDQTQLLKRVLARVDQEPDRFPIWLRYMVIHFSGMRYQSAHGSWADPRELLESLRIDELTQVNRAATKEDLEKEATKTIAALQERKKTEKDNQKVSQIDRQIGLLNNQFRQQQAVLDFQIEGASEEIGELSDQEVLESLRSIKNEFPDWVWKEIVSRTALRLEVEQEDWEKLSAEEIQQRWSWENQHWRSIMDAWERKDITAWRKQHERSLSLIVSRAVCNEIAEHIQHLRGLIPAAGLTSKPVWYLNSQKANPGKSYFKRPTSVGDMKPGASLLFLGWVPREPNAWQITHPLSGVEVLPASAKTAKVKRRGIVEGRGDSWTYLIESNKFIRTSQPFITKVVNPPKVKQVKGPVIKEWLRWTHEATVVDVVEMADGDYVMTYETGQIGVNLRPLSHILNRWDIFVGFIPEGDPDPGKLEDMLDHSKILPPPTAKEAGEPQPAMAFSMPVQTEPRVGEEEFVRAGQSAMTSGMEIVQRWQTLTRREKQVTVLICQGLSTSQAATQLGTSTSTIRSHLSNTMGKFGLHDRETLCAWLADWDF
jgi:DNA-binding CsgD family transcriptional regulator